MQKILKIGEVSKLCDISIKTLRYYEEFGLIKPMKVDIYSGYRYYDENNIQRIYEIQLLKNLGFSLQEIKDFDEQSLKKKVSQLKKEISKLKKNIGILTSLENQKGEKTMKPFINDEKAIGKWKYVASALSKKAYMEGDFYVEHDIFLKELYFLPEGQGYWIFDRWTKGHIYHFTNVVYNYEIADDKMFVEVFNENNEFEILLVFEKENSNAYKIEEIERRDDTNLPFVENGEMVGFWDAVDYIPFADKENYVPRKNPYKQLFLKSLAIKPKGEALFESQKGKVWHAKWTDGAIINGCTVCNAIVKTFGNEQYLIMDWKSGDYVYAGEINGCYVFKKNK